MTLPAPIGAPVLLSTPLGTLPPPLTSSEQAASLLLHPMVPPERQPIPCDASGRPRPVDGIMRGPKGEPLAVDPLTVAPVTFGARTL